MILAPVVRGRRGAHREVMAAIRKAGLVRVRIDGQVYDIDQVPGTGRRGSAHHIDAVVDRVIIREGIRSRVAESVDLASGYGDGLVLVCYLRRDRRRARRGATGCSAPGTPAPKCGISYEELEPRTFSFNSPYGVCPACEGLGSRVEFDPELIMPDPELSLADGAVAPGEGSPRPDIAEDQARTGGFARRPGRSRWDTPLCQLARQRPPEQLLHGAKTAASFPACWCCWKRNSPPRPARNDSEQLAAFRGEVVCAACGGSRLRPEANSVLLGGKTIGQITAMTVGDARRVLCVAGSFATDESADRRAVDLAKSLKRLAVSGPRWAWIPHAGPAGRHAQRRRTAARPPGHRYRIGAGRRLLRAGRTVDRPAPARQPAADRRPARPAGQGNTVLVVEHDEAMMRQADWLIDIGPRAGDDGGRVVAAGTPARGRRQPALRYRPLPGGQRSIPVPAQRRRVAKSRSLVLEGVTTNNLKTSPPSFPWARWSASPA